MDMAHTAMVVQAHWSRLRPIIQKAIPLMGGTYDEEDLIKEVMAGRMTFWPGQRSFILACIERFPRKTRLNVLLGNGDESELLQISERVIAWAKAMGATEAKTEVRPALDRQATKEQRSSLGLKRRRVLWTRDI